MAPRRTVKESDGPKPIYTYGFPKDQITPGLNQLFFDQWAFAWRVPIDKGAPPRMELFRRISDQFLPGFFEWHDWTKRVVQPLCDGNWSGFIGCSNSAKTRNVVGFACIWWLCAPEISSVTIVSTSIKSLRRRGWAEVSKAFTGIPGPRTGNFVDSRMMWQIYKGDDKHAIIGKAVEEGPTHKVADDIKGVHTTRQMVIIDEATAVPEAIFDACSNLYSYPREFILVVIGNPRTKLDQLGKFIEPANGWSSVTVDDDEWESRPQINGKPAVIVHFDAEKSPNIKEGRIVSRHLPMKEKVETARANGQTPLYWSNFRGFPPPDGLSKSVFSESALATNDGFGKHKFTGENFRIIGAFDPAYGGGDRPALRFAKLGQIEGGALGIESFPPIILPIDVSSTNPVHYQLAEQLRRQCESFKEGNWEYHCLPENLAVDDTGAGGLCDILWRTWSYNIIRIEFGGRPSEDNVSLEDARLACDVYLNKRTEMHFRARDCLNHGQLKGIDTETARELCSVLFDDSGKKVKLESKADYKKRNNGTSPDLGDSLVMLLEVARKKGFQLAPMGQTQQRAVDWHETVEKANEVYTDVDYGPEEFEPVT